MENFFQVTIYIIILLSLDEAKNQWQAFLAEMKATNYSLFSFLKTAQFLSCQDNTLEIGLTYMFHLEKVRDIKNKLLIEKMLEKIFGQKMQLEAKLIEENNQFLDNLAQSFGGQVLD